MKGLRPLPSLVLVISLMAAMLALNAVRNLNSQMAAEEQSRLGATFMRAASESSWIVESMRSDGPAESAGLLIGDRIDAIDGHPFAPPEFAERALASHHRVTFHVHRGKQTLDVAINMRKG